MKHKFLFIFFILGCFFTESFSQVTVTISNPITCSQPCATLTAHVIGDVPTNSGITIDDQYADTATSIGFTFSFYGINYTKCLIGPNGTICFDTSLVGEGDAWDITAALAGNPNLYNSVCGPYCDIDIVFGGTITVSTDGVAPNRKFVVTFCRTAMYNPDFCPGEFTTTQMILYETSNLVEVHVAHKTACTSWNGGHAIIGIENATGTSSIAAPGRDYPAVYTCTDEAWRFSPQDTGTGYYYTVDSIPYAPVPYAIDPDSIYWYNATTGAYLGIGDTLRICPDGVASYEAGKLGCADTSFGTYSVSFAPIPITETSTNPTFCGAADGTILIAGLEPDSADIINYLYNDIAQPPVALTASASGTLLLSGLKAGIYSSIIVTQGSCTSDSVNATLVNPPAPNESITGFTNASQCGYNDASITLQTFDAYSSDTINYSFNSEPQAPFYTYTEADGSIFLPGLAVGNYSGFTVTIGQCIYNIIGSANPAAPTIKANFDTSVHLGCHGDSVIFNNYSSAYFDGSAITPGPLYYKWSFDDGNSDTSLNPLHVFTTQGTYTVSLIADNHICSDTFKIPITLFHPLFDSFTASTYIICQDSSIQFTNNSFGTPDRPLSYTWYFGDGLTDTNTNASHSYSNSGAYDVQLIAHDYVPCYDTFTAVLNIDSLRSINVLATDTVICQGTDITFTGLYSDIDNTGINWNFGDGDSITNANPVTYAFNSTGNFIITATASYHACRDAIITRNVSIVPQPRINLGNDTSICAGSMPILLADNINGSNELASWIWNTGQTTPSITIVAPGTYYATVSINNCSAIDTVNVLSDCYMDIPNVFTPNKDGLNDYFYPRQLLSKGLVTFQMDIYNRWGQLIFETHSTEGEGWDGRLNNADQPEGVYVYIIDGTFKDGQKEHHQGNVTLLR